VTVRPDLVTVGGSGLLADRSRLVTTLRPGHVGYRTAWSWQRELASERRHERIGDHLLLLTHPPVYTLGSRGDPGNVLLDAEELRRRGIDVVRVDRGGDVTYHGPGQLVGYPILRLRSREIGRYVEALQRVLIVAVASLGITAVSVPGHVGVWVGGSKLAAIGVRVAAGGVTSHGFALNVTLDPHDFDGIVPCGLPDRGVCSLASLGVDISVDEAADRVEDAFAEVFDVRISAGAGSPAVLAVEPR
jgi:lipoyl(octanoyl) transferase